MSAPATDSVIKEIRSQTSFLGHPKGTGVLSFMQLCNSFANYGMSAILIYYLYTSVADGGLGLSQTDAAQLTSLYSAVVVLAGLVGSFMADRVLGPRRALGLARALQAVGYICLAVPFFGIAGYAASQILLCCAAMISGRSLEAVLGKLYELDDPRRDGAFSITYVISNIGACAPAITGAISLASGYNFAFSFSAILAAAGAASLFATEKKFFGPIGSEPDDPLPPAGKRKFVLGLVAGVVVLVGIGAYLFISGSITIAQFANTVSTAAIFIPLAYLVYIIKSKKTTKAEAGHVIALLPLYVCNAATMVLWSQAISVVSVYADTSVDRTFMGMEFSAATFQTVAAIFSVIFGSLLTVLWTKLGRRQPSTAAKVGLGTAIYSCAPLLMVLPFVLYPAGVKVSPLWIVGFYGLAMLGEAFASPTGYSAASMVAPKAFATQMITVWSLSQSTGAGISTLVTNFYTEGNEVPYFLALGGTVLVISLLVVVFGKKIEAGMGIEETKAGASAE